MANLLCVRKSSSKTRRFPLLPRVGIYFDFGGRQITYKQVPFLETLVNTLSRGFSVENLTQVATEELDDISFDSTPLRRPIKRRPKK